MSPERTITPALDWRVARSCNSGACVRVAAHEHMILVSDSKVPDGPILSYNRDEWAQFVSGVKNGDFDDLG